MKQQDRESLSRVLRLARGASWHGDSEETEEPVSPGTATRIAARWSAQPDVKPPGYWWERLSYAGLAVALLVCGGAFFISHKPGASPSASMPEETGLPDLFHATIADEPSA